MIKICKTCKKEKCICRALVRLQFLQRTHFQLKKFKMESTGCATLDIEVLDACGTWINTVPSDSPLYPFYLGINRHIKMRHLFKYRGVSRIGFVAQFEEYLKSKQAEINAMIEENKLNFKG